MPGERELEAGRARGGNVTRAAQYVGVEQPAFAGVRCRVQRAAQRAGRRVEFMFRLLYARAQQQLFGCGRHCRCFLERCFGVTQVARIAAARELPEQSAHVVGHGLPARR